MRVLVIEDEAALRRVLARALREDGYAVDEADTGTEGLFKATSWNYDAVLLDMMLPDFTGWELLPRLRSDRSTPVIVLTAQDAVAERIRGLDCGADDYLAKPYSLAEVLARVRAVIRRSAGGAATLIAVGDVTIDTAKRRAARGRQLIALTAREYAIVEYLALHRGRLVTKSEIYDHIFDEFDDSLSNLVEVHISNIRKKLGREFVHTRRGMGYQVDG